MAPNPLARSPIRAQANRTPASERALRHASTVMTVPAATPKSARTQHVAIVRTITATTARRTAIATRAVRRRASRTRNSVTSGPTPPGTAAGRSDPIRRAASGLIPIVRRARENLAATKSSLAAPQIGARARISVVVRIVARARILVAARTAANQNRGRSATLLRPITPDATRAPPATAPEISTNPVTTNRVTTAAAMSVRTFRACARIVPRGIVPKVIARFGNGPSSTVPARIVRNSSVRVKGAAPGRSIRAADRGLSIATPTGRAATRRTMLRFSPSVRRSAAAAPIGSARPISTNAQPGLPARRNPASASPRWCRGRDWLRAATPRNGSCRAASPSTAA